MAKTFTTENELKQYLYKIESKAIDAVSKKLLEDFQEHLDETIYNPKHQGIYHRYREKQGFYSGWEIVAGAKSAMNDYVKTLVFNSNNLLLPQDDFINENKAHGGSNRSDIRAMMAKVLNDYGMNKTYSEVSGAHYLDNADCAPGRIGYWDSYLQNLDAKILKWFDDELGSYGIKRG